MIFVFPPRTALLAVTAATHFCHQFSVVSVLKHSDTAEIDAVLVSHQGPLKPSKAFCLSAYREWK